MYENPVPTQNPSEKPPKRKFWQNLLIMDSGDLKKILSLSSMMLSFVLIFVYAAAYILLMPLLAKILGNAPVLLVNLAESLIPAILATGVIMLTWPLFRDKRVLPAAYLWMALFALVSAVFAFFMILDEQAFSEFQEALDPRFARTYLEPGGYSPPSHDKVIRLLDRAVSRGPYNPFPWATAAGYMEFRNDHVAAERFMDEAIRLSPLRSSFYLRRAKIRHAAQADPALVKADLDKVRELFPMNNGYRDVPDSVLLQKESPQ